MSVNVIEQRRLVWPEPRAVLTLLKPVTWFPPVWAFVCGAVASGVPLAPRWSDVLWGALLAGPLVCATSQAANDWFDRHVDAINEPQRPVPSGRLPGRSALMIALAWSALSLAAAFPLGTAVVGAVLIALALAWAYSAPPVRLKQNGWYGNLAVGVTYEGLAWCTGALVASGGTLRLPSIICAVAYSIGAHGILTLNDYKAVEGDRRFGIRSLPVQLGAVRAAWVAVALMGGVQLVVAALLFAWQRNGAAVAVAALLVPQLLLFRAFVRDPFAWALRVSAFGVPFYVSGMMVAAFAVRSLPSGALP